MNQFGSVVSMQAGSSDCTDTGSVERACAAFHAAQEVFVALTKGLDDFVGPELEQARARRNAAIWLVRGQKASTRSALRAKLRVLFVMRDWFSSEDPEVVAFALEVVQETAVLLDKALVDINAGHESRDARSEPRWKGLVRRSGFSWFIASQI